MSNPSSHQPMGPLSVGNVVTAALVLYRSHLKSYLGLSLIANLWVFIPIYGWAKYCAISGMISRLAFGEVIGKPESISSARHYINLRLWSFFSVGFRVTLLLIGALFCVLIPFLTVVELLKFNFEKLFTNSIGSIILIGILTIASIFGCTWFVSRWLLAEIPLAVEENMNSEQSFQRSLKLTKNSVHRIQKVVMVAFLVTLPIETLANYIPDIFLNQIKLSSSLYWHVYFFSWVTSQVGGVLMLPFWQTIKTVLYYDLRSRREGLGLQIRNAMSE